MLEGILFVLLRVIEKACIRPGKDAELSGNVTDVLDVLRAMFVLLSTLAKAGRVLLQMEQDGKIVVDRAKDRCVETTPAPFKVSTSHETRSLSVRLLTYTEII